MSAVQKPIPAAMARALADLRAACDALPPFTPAPVADPIFGNGPRPQAPSTAGLPPQLAAASAELARALAAPPSTPTWPAANTPAIQAMLDKKAGGRPSTVKPHQVVRLVRFVKLGDSLRVAAGKAGLPTTTAHRLLSGQHTMAHHPAVAAAGVHLPPLRTACAVPNPVPRRLSAKSRGGNAAGHGDVAKSEPSPANARFPDPAETEGSA